MLTKIPGRRQRSPNVKIRLLELRNVRHETCDCATENYEIPKSLSSAAADGQDFHNFEISPKTETALVGFKVRVKGLSGPPALSLSLTHKPHFRMLKARVHDESFLSSSGVLVNLALKRLKRHSVTNVPKISPPAIKSFESFLLIFPVSTIISNRLFCAAQVTARRAV